MNKYLLEAAVFICGAVVMVFELTGSRIIAPYLGTSIYTWTNLIGIIMAGLSLGYWLGGKIADVSATFKGLSLVIFLSGLSILLCYISRQSILNSISSPLFATTALFFLPSLFLGAVSPYAAKIKLTTMTTSGSIIGSLYALSTLGSIVGTYLAGYLLIPSLGSSRLLVMLSLVLILLSLVLSRHHATLKTTIALVLIANPFIPAKLPSSYIADLDSQYSRILVKDIKSGSKPTLRTLSTDNLSTQAARYLDSPELAVEYLKYYELGRYFHPTIEHALMIGGAAYSYPQYFLASQPEALLDVVEIDPQMTAVARKYFGLATSPNLKIFHADGRVFLNRNQQIYDAIFVDAFNSITIPFHLTTIEAVAKMYESLSPNGVLVVNLISAITGPHNQFLTAEYLTYSQVFPIVKLFQVNLQTSPTLRQNLVLLALKSPLYSSQRHPLADHEIPIPSPNSRVAILTDDFAPVESYTGL